MTEPLLAAPVVGFTDTVTLRLPVPLVGDRLIQERFSEVVQEQLELEAVTETVLIPPLDVKLPLVGEILYVQGV